MVLVVEALANEDAVCDAEVECDGDDDGDETGPEATNEIGYVANEPDEDEKEGDGFCVSVVVVFDQLGDLLVGRHREYISLSSYTSGKEETYQQEYPACQ